VVHISWNDAMAFCNWLNQKDDKPYTLPTEAQWEFACRGGSPTLFGAGDDPAVLADIAWTRETAHADWVHDTARPVGAKKPNPFGLHDMLGNAYEWCADWYAPGPTGSVPLVDPLNSEDTGRRVARGGTWYFPGLMSRCGHRIGTAPSNPLDAGQGFRIAIVGDLKRVASPNTVPGNQHQRLISLRPNTKAAGESSGQASTHRPGIHRALGLRARSDGLFIVSQT
jgi:formylglycine-generating enzyme required for sulfatase activity